MRKGRKYMRIDDKIKEIEGFISELEGIIPQTFEDYRLNVLKKAACERYFEKIIEAVVDLAFLIIKERKYEKPEEDKSSFVILGKEKIISSELSIKLQQAKGMRNIIAHEYGDIDDEVVFQSIKEGLISDVKEFLDAASDKNG
jgi:uncharacterized protein YutE (UPF0331/DUF86 family)